MMKKEIILGMIALGLVIFSYKAEASIGYTFDGTDTHIWNEGNIEPNYYYSGVCNAQLSNQPNEQWEKVKIGVTYGSTVQDKINNYVELNNGGCSRIEDTDSSSYVNITAYKTVTLAGKSGRLSQNEYIELNDDMMTRTYQFKSNDNINTDVWFVIKRTNIDISANGKDDFIKTYNLDGSSSYLNLTKADEESLTIVRNQNEIEPFIHLVDYFTNQNILFATESNADFKFIINDDSIYLMFKVGTFTTGQSKQLETKWIDAGCSCFPEIIDVQVALEDIPATRFTGTSDIITGSVNYIGISGGGGCSGSELIFQDNTTLANPFDIIPQTANDMDCNGTSCKVSSPNDNVGYNRTIRWNGAGSYALRTYFQCIGSGFDGKFSGERYVNVTTPLNSSYDITHKNTNYGDGYDDSSSYSIDWSLVEQPVRTALSASYINSIGFYHKYAEDKGFVELLGRRAYPLLLIAMMVFIASNQRREEDEKEEV